MAEKVAQADALWVHHEESFAIGQEAESTFPFELACGAECPVKCNDHGERVP